MGALAQMVSELAAMHLKQLWEVHAWTKQQTEVLENLITCSGSLLTRGGPGGASTQQQGLPSYVRWTILDWIDHWCWVWNSLMGSLTALRLSEATARSHGQVHCEFTVTGWQASAAWVEPPWEQLGQAAPN